MVDWKIYIDSPLKVSLNLCRGSLTEGGGGLSRGHHAVDGFGDGEIYGDGDGNGYGGGYSYVDGDGYGYGYGLASGDGWSATKW